MADFRVAALIRQPRIVAAVLLATSFCLPQYTCDMYRAPDGKVMGTVPHGTDPSQYTPFKERHYAWEDLTWSDLSSWLVAVAFFWPVPVLAVGLRTRRRWVSRAATWLEPLLVAGSVYVIWVFSSLGQRAVGAYVGLGASGLYGLGWLYALRVRWRGRAKKRTAEGVAGAAPAE